MGGRASGRHEGSCERCITLPAAPAPAPQADLAAAVLDASDSAHCRALLRCVATEAGTPAAALGGDSGDLSELSPPQVRARLSRKA